MNDLYEQFVEVLGGGLHNREKVTATVVDQVELPLYRREKLLLSAGGRVIPTYLLLPRTDQPRPAILAHHQHNGEYHLGKSEPAGIAGNPDMHYAHRLAERGYVVVTWDAIGFEERNNAFFGRAHEQFLGTKALLEGACLQREYTLDAMYVTDYLLSRPEVLTDSLATIGHSLGGQNVLFTLLLDDRVRVGVSSCGIGTAKSFTEEGIQHNIAWYIPGLLKLGDTPGLAPLLNAKSIFISQGSKDPIFPQRGVQAFADAARAYAEVRLRFFDGPHAFPADAQEAAFAFLAEQLGR
ncbi:alpha/beta hydrolase family protein [Alicyclobacillus fodiniaquatilis]|uniref:Alpha/beta hydrolase family protein n=1 Tax=Alicyclobacillus fodiniaquatilis TaxID=1661150 RepID=A0ABW4JJ85_9BACL